MTPENAETTALKALAWLVADDELLPVFMGATGVDQDALRASAGDPGFLGSVLDFLLMDDAWVIRASDALSLPYDQLAMARQMLPGGAQIHWT
ncbi:hypothetical protein GCM10016455_12230 [Aliiroseovarius zhejiangensis]|uniref:DUF3572 family protein n=1 Tax=Aliiroseovarius zhejiangensis TaxID=1632025 RepID=A0ABQ3IU44_9RHOB|nr:DUF3572 domain-containing protein [Aliiroseovarius zhejiangensis]GHE93603.1 hypothetical protein GCM10016455_12230 [Aliiroseovarius zhejiangensis]